MSLSVNFAEIVWIKSPPAPLNWWLSFNKFWLYYPNSAKIYCYCSVRRDVLTTKSVSLVVLYLSIISLRFHTNQPFDPLSGTIIYKEKKILFKMCNCTCFHSISITPNFMVFTRKKRLINLSLSISINHKF